ncbi:MAG: hypothetical protein GX349_06440 [Firmicutes bacterium]|nr:hypothetical protein [Bacillota bacterium]
MQYLISIIWGEVEERLTNSIYRDLGNDMKGGERSHRRSLKTFPGFWTGPVVNNYRTVTVHARIMAGEALSHLMRGEEVSYAV